MIDDHPHINSKFDNDLSRFRNELSHMGATALKSFERAVDGLMEGNREQCSDVIADDEIIDKQEKRVDELGMGVLLRFQPVASDLRLVVSSLNIGRSLERIGDHAVNIARRGRKILDHGICEESRLVEPLFRGAHKITVMAIEAYNDLDQDKAHQVIEMDEEVDQIYKQFSNDISMMISQKAENAESLINLLFVARSLERVGDLAANVAEDVIFITSAEDVRHT